MISYELILSSAVLAVILLTGTFHFSSIIESQQSVWFLIPLLPLFIIFFISVLAETNRTPFDLPEATWLPQAIICLNMGCLLTYPFAPAGGARVITVAVYPIN